MNKSIYTKRHKKFCELLIQKRKEAGLTQEELAKKLNRPQSFVAKYEGGERRVDVIEFLEISTALDIKLPNFIKLLQDL